MDLAAQLDPEDDRDRACLHLIERLAAVLTDCVSFDRVFIERPIGAEPNSMLMIYESRVMPLKLHRR
jgi:hypothetical protein